jgi:hypothetical protein
MRTRIYDLSMRTQVGRTQVALVIQHYREVQATKSRVEMYSVRSLAYLMHVLPVLMGARWTMSVAPRTADTSTFSCSIEVVPPAGLRSLMRVMRIRRAIRKHVEQETETYAADLSQKLQPEIATKTARGASPQALSRRSPPVRQLRPSSGVRQARPSSRATPRGVQARAAPREGGRRTRCGRARCAECAGVAPTDPDRQDATAH